MGKVLEILLKILLHNSIQNKEINSQYMYKEVSQIIKNLLAETEYLQELFKDFGKKFTLDGCLVGDLGEVKIFRHIINKEQRV